jgi:hypothetical protein
MCLEFCNTLKLGGELIYQIFCLPQFCPYLEIAFRKKEVL